jgi:hypothetical protein
MPVGRASEAVLVQRAVFVVIAEDVATTARQRPFMGY